MEDETEEKVTEESTEEQTTEEQTTEEETTEETSIDELAEEQVALAELPEGATLVYENHFDGVESFENMTLAEIAKGNKAVEFTTDLTGTTDTTSSVPSADIYVSKTGSD